MAILVANNATSYLAGTLTAVATSLTVSSGTGTLFPTLSGSDVFYVTLTNVSNQNEIVKVTAKATDTFTIVRAQDGTSALAFAIGDKVELRVIKVVFDDKASLTNDQTFSGANTFSGGILFGAGTAALPSVTTTGDTNTGMFFPAADTIAFAEGGVEAMRIDSSGIVTGTAGNLMLISGTSVSISGSPTSVAFTGLPSWVKRIVIQLQDVSTNGTSNHIVQLGYGTTPTYVATGYSGTCNTQAGTGTQNSTGFTIANSSTAANTWSGHIILTNITGNIWVESSNLGATDTSSNRYSSGNNSATAQLTAVRITTVIGTQTFDTGGVINISYE